MLLPMSLFLGGHQRFASRNVCLSRSSVVAMIVAAMISILAKSFISLLLGMENVSNIDYNTK